MLPFILNSFNVRVIEFLQVLMTQLQTALENTDLPELLMGTVDVIILLTEIYPSTFTKHFRVKLFNKQA
jgi:hypothetical protein